MNRFDKMAIKLIGKAKVLIMGRRSKREKRLAKQAANRVNKHQETTRFNGMVKEGSSGITISASVDKSGKVTSGNTYESFLANDHSHNISYVAKLGAFQIYAATKSNIELADAQDIDLVVNCSQSALNARTSKYKLVDGPTCFDELGSLVYQFTEVSFDWDDGRDFPATIKFWKRFREICEEKNYHRLLFTCFGGHGRTGTALSAFLLANSKYYPNNGELLVDQLRLHYCKEAVETLIQENYLEKLELELLKLEEYPNAGYAEVEWQDKCPGDLVYYKKYWQASTAGGLPSQPQGLGAKTLTEVIAEAKARADIKQDVFGGHGDASAEQLSSQEANRAIIIDLIKEDREKELAEFFRCNKCNVDLSKASKVEQSSLVCHKCWSNLRS
jgi:hypothetical protein